MRAFPSKFSFAREPWQGPRAAYFVDREDAFQQLVGDVLREALGDRVSVSPTAGKDGSIDAFIAGDAELSPLFPLLSGPIIVECKHNDDAQGAPTDNILRSWKKVEEKLAAQAKAGWHDLYTPWAKAHSYLYITSAVIPHKSAREKLDKAVQEFFKGLRKKRRTQIEQVRIVDWTDLRALLDRYPRLADQWLGIGLRSLRSHVEYIDALTGFERYLIDLQFVPPEPSHDAHPNRLLDRAIKRAQIGGVLLTGPGGAGKTRTLLEVAKRADALGYRVLRAIHGEPVLSVNELGEEILQGAGPVLVIFDYLDRHTIDIGSIKRQIFPAAAQRGIRLCFLAAERTARDVHSRTDRAEFFEVVGMNLGVQQATRIVHQMQETVAPQATAALGGEVVQKRAGKRPIIALLVLRELERRAAIGNLEELDSITIRQGDLLHWLRRRLAEDKLLFPIPSSPWEVEKVDPALVASATVLAAAPMPEPMIKDAALRALERLPDLNCSPVTAPSTVSRIIESLKDLGWLHQIDGVLVVAHDVVTDEILEQVLRAAGDQVREDTLAAILAPCLVSTYALAHVAVAFRRLIVNASPFERALLDQCEHWFDVGARAIGSSLCAASPNQASYAMNSLIEGLPWLKTMLARWAEVVGPWLDCHGEAEASRLPLALLLARRDLPPGGASSILKTAFRWLNKHGDTEAAAVVLSMLLERVDLKPKTVLRVVRRTVRWHRKYRNTLHAGLVLGALLERHDIRKRLSEHILIRAFNWSLQHRDTDVAGFTLGMALLRVQRSNPLVPRLIKRGIAWLRTHGYAVEAAHVLGGLICRHEIDASQRAKLIKKAVSWRRNHASSLNSLVVLFALLARKDMAPVIVTEAAAAVPPLLARYSERFENAYILRQCLSRFDINAGLMERLVEAAFHWLERFGDHAMAHLVLPPLVSRPDLRAETRARAAEACMVWLEKHGRSRKAALVLASLLERPELVAFVVPRSHVWLDRHHDTAIAGVVLGLLTMRIVNQSEVLPRVLLQASTWLEKHADAEEAGYPLGALLAPEVAVQSNVDITATAVSWLERHHGSPQAFPTIAGLLANSQTPPEVYRRTVLLAVPWLEEYGALPLAGPVLPPLLASTGLRPDLRVRVTELAIRWLEMNFDNPVVPYVLSSWTGPEERSSEHAARATQLGLSWLEANRNHALALQILRQILHQGNLCHGRAARALELILSWITIHNAEFKPVLALLCLFLPRLDLDENSASRAIDAAFGYIGPELDADLRGVLLSNIFIALYRNPELAPKFLKRAAHASFAWLDKYRGTSVASLVLVRLVSFRGLEASQSAAAIQMALDWLEAMGSESEAGLLLLALFQRNDISPNAVKRIQSIAFSWLDQHGETPMADWVLYAFIFHADLDGERFLHVLLTTLAWLGNDGYSSEDQLLWRCFFGSESNSEFFREFADMGISYSRALLDGPESERASLAVPAILPLAKRASSARLFARAKTLTKEVLRPKRLTADVRRKFVAASYYLVDHGAWVDCTEAEKLLSEFGIQRPAS